jgi:ubiquinone/menaquinone biosynthesis C-methylase UbiE
MKPQKEIRRGQSAMNDYIIDFLKTQISGEYLDIGCNSGWLLSELPGGMGVDIDRYLVKRAKAKGLKVVTSTAECLPFSRDTFDISVLSMVLQNIINWEDALGEAIRVSKKCIGIIPDFKKYLIPDDEVDCLLSTPFFDSVTPEWLVSKSWGYAFRVRKRHIDYNLIYFEITRY